MEGGNGERKEGGNSVPEGGDWSGHWAPETAMGVEGKGRRDRETDGALALDGRRPDGPGSRGSCGARSGDAIPGTRAEAGGEVSPLAGSAAGPQPCAPRQAASAQSWNPLGAGGLAGK
ncbi:guanine nucleotide-binding protein G(I)/G(S)/G(O) subunit gamma-12 isoform X2 [Cervus elaphus]|uniref:guanine nucleotide-binding protein G(I)/G(S)/G(O) subunit gamma-12 isoform X2 n=1 Tax=Cervus elaphus TaxID=9860 RepID=UPI001CC30657|nr:guanine nucleotide-binding protein G(I)/G(S)/G(O) subunit gamma-12 isoform X2 [Cervus elaphus]